MACEKGRCGVENWIKKDAEFYQVKIISELQLNIFIYFAIYFPLSCNSPSKSDIYKVPKTWLLCMLDCSTSCDLSIVFLYIIKESRSLKISSANV